MRKPWWIVAVALVGSVETAPGKTVFEPGADPALDAHMDRHTRLFNGLHAFPFGIGLTISRLNEPYGPEFLREWLDEGQGLSLLEWGGVHPYEVVGEYEGPAGIGLRGGGASPGSAFRYMALKAEGAPPEVLAEAREEVVKAIETLWVVHVITGIPHGVARGVMLLAPLHEGEPPFPHVTPNIVPLFDDQGSPLPPDPKNNGTDRADNSGGVLPEGLWFWQDSCSKDQLVGWVAAIATLYDAVADDPDVDPALVQRLRDVACAIGAGLRVKYPFTALDGNEYLYDLVIMDADGRPTKHHDLNPLGFDGGMYLPPGSPNINVFNLLMGLGIVKGLYHACGDAESEEFLYGELLGNRDYLGLIPQGEDSPAVDYIYAGAKTNFSNVNMVAIALFLNLYFEGDDAVAAPVRDFMERRWWDAPGVIQAARHLKQPYFHALYEGMTATGTDPARAAEAAALLKAFALDPYTDEARNNCDEAELAQGSCLAVDGKTLLTLQKETNRGGHPIATEPLDPSIRPPSNFDARSDPFVVNGGGGPGLNPGGDLHAAYWILRFLPERPAGVAALSPRARDHRPVQQTSEGVEVAEAGGGDPAPQAEDTPPLVETTNDSGPAGDVAQGDDSGTHSPDGTSQDAGLDEPPPASGGGSGCSASAAAPPGWWLAALLAGARLGFGRNRGRRL